MELSFDVEKLEKAYESAVDQMKKIEANLKKQVRFNKFAKEVRRLGTDVSGKDGKSPSDWPDMVSESRDRVIRAARSLMDAID